MQFIVPYVFLYMLQPSIRSQNSIKKPPAATGGIHISLAFTLRHHHCIDDMDHPIFLIHIFDSDRCHISFTIFQREL